MQQEVTAGCTLTTQHYLAREFVLLLERCRQCRRLHLGREGSGSGLQRKGAGKVSCEQMDVARLDVLKGAACIELERD
eukprot:5312845-Pleurochrysis_carterae.AAC.2